MWMYPILGFPHPNVESNKLDSDNTGQIPVAN